MEGPTLWRRYLNHTGYSSGRSASGKCTPLGSWKPSFACSRANAAVHAVQLMSNCAVMSPLYSSTRWAGQPPSTRILSGNTAASACTADADASPTASGARGASGGEEEVASLRGSVGILLGGGEGNSGAGGEGEGGEGDGGEGDGGEGDGGGGEREGVGVGNTDGPGAAWRLDLAGPRPCDSFDAGVEDRSLSATGEPSLEGSPDAARDRR